ALFWEYARARTWRYCQFEPCPLIEASMQRSVLLPWVSVIPACLIGMTGSSPAQDVNRPTIPKAWDERALATLEVPLARPDISPVHVSADCYERIPVRPIYKTYPVYHPA